MRYFPYGEPEISFLKGRDEKLAAYIEKTGMLRYPVIDDLYQALVCQIIGQQISPKAAETVWSRARALLSPVTPEYIRSLPAEEIAKIGVSARKADAIRQAAERFADGTLDGRALAQMDDEAFCREMKKLKGVGQWTCEMLLIFCLRRTDVFSFGDYGIAKGLCKLHGHSEMTEEIFRGYQNRYSPYGTVASFYLWRIAADKTLGD